MGRLTAVLFQEGHRPERHQKNGIQLKSGIRDNRNRGKVADFLKEKTANGSHLSIVSAYFTIYAYEALSEQLDRIDSLKFSFGEPKFI